MRLGIRVQQMRQQLADLVSSSDPVAEEGVDVDPLQTLQQGQGGQIDPAMGMPMEGAVDPATGQPMDPAAAGAPGGAQAPGGAPAAAPPAQGAAPAKPKSESKPKEKSEKKDSKDSKVEVKVGGISNVISGFEDAVTGRGARNAANEIKHMGDAGEKRLAQYINQRANRTTARAAVGLGALGAVKLIKDRHKEKKAGVHERAERAAEDDAEHKGGLTGAALGGLAGRLSGSRSSSRTAAGTIGGLLVGGAIGKKRGQLGFQREHTDRLSRQEHTLEGGRRARKEKLEEKGKEAGIGKKIGDMVAKGGNRFAEGMAANPTVRKAAKTHTAVVGGAGAASVGTSIHQGRKTRKAIEEHNHKEAGLAKAEGLKRVGQLLTGSRAKAMEAAAKGPVMKSLAHVERQTSKAARVSAGTVAALPVAAGAAAIAHKKTKETTNG
jgi:hypothetical protein